MNQLVNAKGEPCLSITGAAKVLGVSRQAVSQMVAKGRLPVEYHQWSAGYRMGVIPVAAVQAWRRRKKRLTDRKETA